MKIKSEDNELGNCFKVNYKRILFIQLLYYYIDVKDKYNMLIMK